MEASAVHREPYKIGGLSSSSSLYFIANHFDQALIVFPSNLSLSLDDCQKALSHFLLQKSKKSELYIFPELDPTYNSVGGSPEKSFRRIETQLAISQSKKNSRFILTTGLALSQKVLTPEELNRSIFCVKKGEWIDRDQLVFRLRQLGYRRDEIAEDAGFYSVRGHLIDVYPMGIDHPLRLEFFGDEIVSIRHFDPESQRSLQERESFDFLPLRELIPTEKNMERARRSLKDLGDSNGIPREVRDDLLWQIEHQKDLFEFRWVLPAFSDALVSFDSYLPKNIPVILIDPEKIELEIESDLRATQEEFRDFKKLAYSPEHLRTHPEIFSENSHRLWSHISSQGINYQSLGFEDLRHRLSRAKNYSPLIEILQEARKNASSVHLVFRNEKRRKNLVELLGSELHDCLIEEGETFPGFQSTSLRQTVITERDLYGFKKKKSRSASQVNAAQFLREFGDLKELDYVVHEDHGLGRYQGLVKLNVGKVENEFILIEYAEADKLYLPIYKVDKISRYVSGSSHAHPRLDRLGSLSFSKRKSRAKKDIYQIAHDLMQVAAERRLKPIDRKSIDEFAYQDFCDQFGFDLTSDQDSAIRDCLDDLQKNFPMDRLICGDVGFGKTEVALRAAMFRLLQGTQVAVLAPTTLLAEQHFRNFHKRFQNTGFRVERLSRFVSPSAQKKIIQELADGKVDLIIGTHRLLQKDIRFRNLGMLIIDEEQRFGVKHKEKIKKMRAELDVLALSATPIPRTLQMSIVGIRELSLIVTPPETREAVDTYVGAFDKKLVREKVMREIDRGGQVFFVHNRVKTIYSLQEELREILPNIKTVVAHGQMKEEELENTMIDFVERRADLLLATSIIENGIDIPNANTLIVDRADLFGLSDLYQLRGRVGRGNRKAFSFFLIREENPLTTEASKRLQVLQSCTELGSGFKVASHDLEIRGSGNLLGEAQSGVISEIGLELYNQMLQETLEEIKSGKITRHELPEVKAAFSAFIPEDYIPDASVRISTYRRLNQLQNLQELLEFEDELLDRFGLFSHEVEVLLAVTRLRIRAAEIHASEIDCSFGRLQLELKDSTPLDPIALTKKSPPGFHFDSKGRIVLSFESANENPELMRSTNLSRPELYDLQQSLLLTDHLVQSLEDKSNPNGKNSRL